MLKSAIFKAIYFLKNPVKNNTDSPENAFFLKLNITKTLTATLLACYFCFLEKDGKTPFFHNFPFFPPPDEFLGNIAQS